MKQFQFQHCFSSVGPVGKTSKSSKALEKMVGAVRFELTTSCTRNKRASQATLRPEPIFRHLIFLPASAVDDMILKSDAVRKSACHHYSKYSLPAAQTPPANQHPKVVTRLSCTIPMAGQAHSSQRPILISWEIAMHPKKRSQDCLR